MSLALLTFRAGRRRLTRPSFDGKGSPSIDFTRRSTDRITPAQLKFVERLIAETRNDLDQLLAFFGFESLSTIPKAEVNRVIRALESKRRAT